jgi:V8-like Glu-specific endopeptidase
MGKQHHELSEEQLKLARELYLYRTPTSEVNRNTPEWMSSTEFATMGVAEKAAQFSGRVFNPEGPGKEARDDRMEVYEFKDQSSDAWRQFQETGAFDQIKDDLDGFRLGVEKAYKSTAVLMFRSQWEAYMTGMRLDLQARLQAAHNTRKPFRGRYAEQVSMARGTGFLVGPDLLLTAYHNLHLTGQWVLDSLVFVFGFHVKAPDGLPLVDDLEVRKAKSVVFDASEDWALIRLDAPLRDKQNYLKLSATPLDRKVTTPLYIVGSSSGLPLKMCLCGHAIPGGNAEEFRTCLDVFGGNSGSPVINLKTHAVEGILVKGAKDFDSRSFDWIEPIRYTYADLVANVHGERCTSAHAINLELSSITFR